MRFWGSGIWVQGFRVSGRSQVLVVRVGLGFRVFGLVDAYELLGPPLVRALNPTPPNPLVRALTLSEKFSVGWPLRDLRGFQDSCIRVRV